MTLKFDDPRSRFDRAAVLDAIRSHHGAIADEAGSDDTFVRIEDKFILPTRYEPELLGLLDRWLKPSCHQSGTRYTVVDSLYLDSPELHFLRDHMLGARERYKVRLRRYAPDGVATQHVTFLEAKRKTDGICTKERIALDPASVEAVVAGRSVTLSPALVAGNPQLREKKLASRLKRIGELIESRAAMPRVSVAYHRRAYESDGLRITVDGNVQSELRSSIDRQLAAKLRRELAFVDLDRYSSHFDPERTVIVEVKHTAGRPAWLDTFMDSVGTTATNFSKYCYSMLRAIGRAS